MDNLSTSTFYDDNSDQLKRWLLNKNMPRTTDDEELGMLLEDPVSILSTTLASDRLRYPGNAASKESMTVPTPSWEEYEKTRLNGNMTAEALPVPERERPEYTGTTNVKETFLLDEKINQKGRISSAFRLGQTESGDTAGLDFMERRLHRDDTKYDAETSTEYARMLGSDLKFTMPKSKFEVEQAVRKKQTREELEQSLLMYSSTGDRGWLSDAYVMASMLAGSIGPMEIGANVAAAFIPGGITKGVASGAGKIEQALGLKKVLDVSRSVEKAKTADRILKATGVRNSIYFKNGSSAAKAAILEEQNLKLAKFLRDTSGITYDTLTPYTKLGGDMLSVLAVDVPIILTKKENSDVLEIDSYSEKDKATETLLAAAGGAFLPYGIRKVGEKLGIQPSEMVARRLDLIENDIKYKRATGKVSKEKAKKQLEAVAKIRENEAKINELRREPNKYIKQMVAQLRQSQMSDKTMAEFYAYVYNSLKQGNIPDPKKAPMGEMFFTSLHGDYFRAMAQGSTLVNVFGPNIIKLGKKVHTFSMKILGENGYLGNHFLTGINEKETLTYLDKMYRGYALNDKEALLDFKQWISRGREFTDNIEKILQQYTADQRHNATSATKKGASKLVDMRTNLLIAFFKYKMGTENLDEFTKALKSNLRRKRQGLDAIEAPEYKELNAEFEEFYSRFVIEKEEKGRVLYDLIDSSKGSKSVPAKDGSKSDLAKFIKELREGEQDNAMLDLADDYFAKWDEDTKMDFINSYEKLDLPEGTDSKMLFGTPFREYSELLDLPARMDEVSFLTDLEELKFLELENNLEIKEIMDIYSSNVNKSDPNMYNHSKVAISNLESIAASKKEGYNVVKNTVLEMFRNSTRLQEHVRNLYEGKGGWNYALETNLRDALAAGLGKTTLKDLTEGIDDIISASVKAIKEEFENNPEAAKALLSLENLKEMGKLYDEPGAYSFDIASVADDLNPAQKSALEGLNDVAEKEIQEQRKALSEIHTAISVMFAPAEKMINYKLNLLKLRYMHDLNIQRVKMMQPMVQNPEIAAEIITGLSTQTNYVYKNSGLSVEYKAKDSVFFERSILNKLKGMTSTDGGRTLADVFEDESAAEDIVKDMLRIQYGEPIKENTDTGRIAKEIMSHFYTAFNFKKLGSEFVPEIRVFDNSKIKGLDSMLTDDELTDFFKKIEEAWSNNKALIQDILKNIDVDEEGKLLLGKERVTKEQAEEIIDIRLNQMLQQIHDVSNFRNVLDKKLAVLALKELDLDYHFNNGGRVRTSLNEVRNAILNGKWKEILEGDLQKLNDATIDLKYLITEIVGKPRPHGSLDGTIMPDATKWVHRFKAGFGNLDAVREGSLSAYVDELGSGLRFKDSETAIRIWSICGEKNLNRFLHTNFDKLTKAYYSLENHGSRPWPMAEEAISAYNRAIKEGHLANKLATIAELKNISNPEEKFAISTGATESAKQNILLNNGLQNRAPSMWARFIKATQTVLASPLLFKAGLKSLSDHATIWEGLMTNAYVDNRGEAFALTSKMSQFILQNPKEAAMIIAAGIVKQEDILKTLLNDPAADVLSTSKNLTWLDSYESFSRTMADMCLNKMAHISDVTNFNKQVAALSIQNAIAEHAHISYKELPDNYKLALERDGIEEADWEFLRKNFVQGAYDDLGVEKGKSPFSIFNPYLINKITDEQLFEELSARGVKNISQDELNSFRNELMVKSWVLVDSAADEMVSLPSNRVLNWMRGGRARNTGWGTVIEVLTQFQSFGAALLYNTYGKKLANFSARETGVSMLDLFNPAVKLNHATRPEIYRSLLASFATVATTMLAVDSLVNATTGNIVAPIDSEGKAHPEMIISSALGALGAGGPILNAIGEGISGAGQRGGGFTIQVAPSVSNALRVGYRLAKPLRSSDVEDRGVAFSSAVAQEVARATGLRTLPFIGLFWQAGIGSWLDSNAAGSVEHYERMLRNKEENGQLIAPWEIDPVPFWERL